MPKSSSAARREQARALAAEEGISYTQALRRLAAAQSAADETDPGPDAVVQKSKNTIRGLADALGVPYSAAARRLDGARRAEATAVREEKRWRLVSPEEPDGRTLSWRVAVSLDDRGTFTDSAGRHLGSLGWDVVSWPADLAGTVTIPVVRNLDGMLEDEAVRLHKAAGVTYHSAHDAYVYAVADAVAATGLKIGDVNADAGEPREGWFRIGGDLADFLEVDGDRDESGFGTSTVVAWDERRGWYHVYYSDSQKAQGDYAADLPGPALGTAARPEDVAVAVARLAGVMLGGGLDDDEALPRAPLPWDLPEGYDDNPPLPEDNGWEVSARLERSLVAYIGLQAPDPAAVRTADAATVTIMADGFTDEDWIRNGVWEKASSRDEQELGPGEHWDYQAIEDAWVAECRYSAAEHGITWYRQAQTVTVPACMTDGEAVEIWQRILDRFPAWISSVIGEARKGRSYVSGDDVRSSMAPGSSWVIPRDEA